MPKLVSFKAFFYALFTWAVLVSIVGHQIPILSDSILFMFVVGFPITLFYIAYSFYGR